MRREAQRDPSASVATDIPLWQPWFPRAGTVAAAVTTICCLGVPPPSPLPQHGRDLPHKGRALKATAHRDHHLDGGGQRAHLPASPNPVPLLPTALTGAGSSCSYSSSPALPAPSSGQGWRPSSVSKSGMWFWFGNAGLHEPSQQGRTPPHETGREDCASIAGSETKVR